MNLPCWQAMVSMLNKDEKAKRVRDKVYLKMEEVSKTGINVIKGRQVIWLLLDSFRTSDNSDQIYGFDH